MESFMNESSVKDVEKLESAVYDSMRQQIDATLDVMFADARMRQSRIEINSDSGVVSGGYEEVDGKKFGITAPDGKFSLTVIVHPPRV